MMIILISIKYDELASDLQYRSRKTKSKYF